MAAAAYNAGEKMYSERDHEWKHPHSSPERVVYREVMLPDNAPREYADSQTLWNAVDAAEKRKDAQTARRMLIVLPKELTYEPALALFGGEDGLNFYRRLAAEWEKHLVPGGLLLMEIGHTQGKAVQELFPGAKIIKDICGLDRVVWVERI